MHCLITACNVNQVDGLPWTQGVRGSNPRTLTIQCLVSVGDYILGFHPSVEGLTPSQGSKQLVISVRVSTTGFEPVGLGSNPRWPANFVTVCFPREYTLVMVAD